MKLEVFEKVINQIKEQDEKISALYKMGVDLIEFSDSYSSLRSLLLRAYYGEEGEDWISWFLYERDSSVGADPNQAWDKDGTPICYDIPSLWKCIEEIRCSTDFVEYEIPKSKATADDLLNQILNGRA
jgi:hypothetical protein